MKKPFLITISAALVTTAASCTPGASNGANSADPPRNPPDPTQSPTITHNPPMPTVAASTAPPSASSSSGLPHWEDVASTHPVGATNPPSPYLVVTPEGACYKVWEGGMTRGGPDRVEACGNACKGTHIECTPKAAELLAAYRPAPVASGSSGPSTPPPIHRNPPPPSKK
jgi:hypothetical protein